MRRHQLPFLLLLLIACGEACAQATLHVPADYATIQQAIDNAADGDTVLVGPGTYYEQIVFGTHQISVESSDGRDVTTIDATFLGPVVTFSSASTRQTKLKGFTITRGKGSYGGIKIYQGSPTIEGNTVTNNLGEGAGNGVSAEFSSALIIDNYITNNANDTEYNGGGGGGGIYVGGSQCADASCGVEIRGNVIDGNSVDRFTSGGGIDVNSGGYVKIFDNIIRNNTAPTEGGGISMVNSTQAQIEDNLFVDNQAPSGANVYWLTPAGDRGAFLINNTIVGGDVYADGFDTSSRIINNVISFPGGTAIYCGNFTTTTPIVMNNDAYTNGGTSYGGLCAGFDGTGGNISDQPIFRGANDYRLAAGSPGIDAGANPFATETTDILGNPRIVDGNGDGVATIDMGAYEFDDIFGDGFEGD